MIWLKTTSFVRAQHCCAPTAWTIYVVYRRRHRRIIKKSLKQQIFVNSHDDAFVQWVSPNLEKAFCIWLEVVFSQDGDLARLMTKTKKID